MDRSLLKSALRMSKFQFYLQNIAQFLFCPDVSYRAILDSKLSSVSDFDESEILNRVEYYNKVDFEFQLGDSSKRLSDLSLFEKTLYYFDYRRILRHFPKTNRAEYLFGDINWVLNMPTFVKSRPIVKDNENNVLLRLVSARHFFTISDPFSYSEKKDSLIWRGAAKQAHRRVLLEKHFNTSCCDVGHVGESVEGLESAWQKNKLSIFEQLKYKFILSIEGYDVATNLKWIAQSNSVCFMTKPKVESWFMEGCLIPDFHYVLLKDDYSDLEEKVEFYISNPGQAEEISRNLQKYYSGFSDLKKEELIGLLVAKKYFELSGQI